MSKTAVFAKLTAQPGQRDDLRATLEKMLPTVEAEEGTLVYALHEDLGDDNVLWLWELYADDAALAAHSGSEAMKELIGAFAGVLGAPPELCLARPVAGKGIDV
jgi:quinol monooxygenase YgiN